MKSGLLAEIRAEHRKRLFDRFEKRAGAFVTVLGATLTFALAFAALVHVPYVRLGLQQDALTTELGMLEKRRLDFGARIGEAERTIAAAAVTAVALAKANEEARVAAREALDHGASLQNMLRGTERALASLAVERQRRAAIVEAAPALDAALAQLGPNIPAPALAAALQRAAAEARQAPTGPGCREESADDRLACHADAPVTAAGRETVRRVRAALFDGSPLDPAAYAARERLLDDFASHLRNALFADGRFGDGPGIRHALAAGVEASLAAAVQDATQATRAALREAPARTEAEIAAMARDAEIQRAGLVEAERRLAPYRDGERTRAAAADAAERRHVAALEAVAAAQAQRDALLPQVAALQGEHARVGRARDEVAHSIERLQTPFGTMPIGATDGILAFPIVVTAGFFVAGLLLADAARLKAEFRLQCRAWDREGRVLDDAQLALVAPLWFDPARPLISRVALGAAFSLPPAVAAVSVALIVWDWHRSANPLAGPELQPAYAVLYLIAAALVVVAVQRVASAFERLAAPLPEPVPDAEPPAIR